MFCNIKWERLSHVTNQTSTNWVWVQCSLTLFFLANFFPPHSFMMSFKKSLSLLHLWIIFFFVYTFLFRRCRRFNDQVYTPKKYQKRSLRVCRKWMKKKTFSEVSNSKQTHRKNLYGEIVVKIENSEINKKINDRTLFCCRTSAVFFMMVMM